MGPEQNKYELAYLLSPALDEATANSLVEKLTEAIEVLKGVIRHKENPRKRRLQYPIKKEGTAYFGWITFIIARESVGAVEKKLVGMEGLLRHLIVIEEEIPVQSLRTYTPRSSSIPAKSRPAPTEAENPDEKLDLEELDKRLEEILGK